MRMPETFASETPVRRARDRRRPWMALALIAALLWPTAYPIVLGSVQLPPYRVVLILGALLAAQRCLSGALRMRLPDYLVAIFGLGAVVSLIANHGLFTPFRADFGRGAVGESLPYEAAAVAFLETAGAYFLARAVIVGPAQFDAVMKALGWAVVVVCGFTVVEARTGVNVFNVYAGSGIGEVRFGLHRAAGTFPHSILWGLFAATLFAYFAARAVMKRKPGALGFALASVVGVATSVSSTAVLAVFIQAMALAWGWFVRHRRRWTLFAIGLIAVCMLLEVLSERPLVRVLVASLSFSPDTGFIRLVQWEYGWREALAHPLLGMGFHDWARPRWLAASIDSYWLVLAVRHGLIVPAFLLAAIVALLRQSAKAYKRDDSPQSRLLIRICAITVVSLAVAGFSVHFWAQSLVLFFFLLGALSALTQARGARRARRP
jgi:hypothetical protein